MMKFANFSIFLIFITLIQASCVTIENGQPFGEPFGEPASQSASSPSADSLYQRLGGQPAIKAVVNDFVANVANDKRINQFFSDTDLLEFKRLLVEQICEASGGPCVYSGRPMRAAHAGLNITDQHFAALVEDLQKTLDTFKVPAAEQNELLTVLAAMKDDIVR